MTDSIGARIKALQDSVVQIAEKAGRNPSEIQIVLVTKTVAVERIQEAYEAGIRDFGENRVQEMLSKTPLLPSDVRWHMIGSLQTNKVKHVVGQAAMIQSVDRPELFSEIEKQANKVSQKIPCLLQIDNSGEASKSGFKPDEAIVFLNSISEDSPVIFEGLMTIGPNQNDSKIVRDCFCEIEDLRKKLKMNFPRFSWKTLSMGMSNDYETAIEAGSTMIRVGSAVFGKRPTQ